jgi:hypothetical protein
MMMMMMMMTDQGVVVIYTSHGVLLEEQDPGHYDGMRILLRWVTQRMHTEF